MQDLDKILRYTLREEDLARTAGGLVNLVLRSCVRVTGHEISAAKFLPEGITCDGALIRVNERMQPGQTLQIILPEECDAGKLLPVKGPVRILYEDEDLIAVDKEAGEVVHPCPGHYTDTVANYLTDYLKDSSGLRIIGRLDKETSGVLVFARNRASAARLQRQREEGRFVRTYEALCEGWFPENAKAGTIDRDMEKVPGVLMKMRVCAPGTTGLRAVTHYEVLREFAAKESEGNTLACQGAAVQSKNSLPVCRDATGQSENSMPTCRGAAAKEAAGPGLREYSLLRLHIDTGRTHQIRVHMASIGHPLVDDTLYGSAADTDGMDHVKSMAGGDGSAGRHAMLQAVCVELDQPFTGERLCIRSRLQGDFGNAT